MRRYIKIWELFLFEKEDLWAVDNKSVTYLLYRDSRVEHKYIRETPYLQLVFCMVKYL